LECIAATVADADTICALDIADMVCNAFSLAACSVGTTYSPTTHVTLYLYTLKYMTNRLMRKITKNKNNKPPWASTLNVSTTTALMIVIIK